MKKLFLIGGLICIFLSFLLKDCFFNFEPQKNLILIAHAGGAFNGQIYLNSKEAVENAIKNGFHYIELDLLETSDGDLVAAHDWKMFHQLTGFSTQEHPITQKEAQERKILKNQTVLTSKEIHDIFMSNPTLYLVTDKIQNIDLLNKKFGDFKDRIIVEVFSIERYKEVQEKGFFHPAFCVWDSEKLYQLVDENQIDMITLSGDSVYQKIKWYKKHPEITAFAFTSKNGIANNKKAIQGLLPHINGWYTDFLTPKMFLEN